MARPIKPTTAAEEKVEEPVLAKKEEAPAVPAFPETWLKDQDEAWSGW